MDAKASIYSIDTLIGMTILSRQTGNKIGKVLDLIVDSSTGRLDGLVVTGLAEEELVLNYASISSFGQDAVMAYEDDSVVPPAEGELARRPCAKRDLIGASLITEGGRFLGKVANIFVNLAPPPFAIYELRDSLLDKLLGKVSYVPASLGRALSGDGERIIVPDDAMEYSAPTLEAFTQIREEAAVVEDETRVRREPMDDSSFVAGA